VLYCRSASTKSGRYWLELSGRCDLAPGQQAYIQQAYIQQAYIKILSSQSWDGACRECLRDTLG
jgi:hypothetical protein